MGGPRKPAGKEKQVCKPYNWEKVVLAAYFRALGYTQVEAASHAGCSERSIQTWESSDIWKQACEEGLSRWNGQFVARCRRGLIQSFDDPQEYAKTSRWGAERTIKYLAPPAVRAQLAGKDGEPIDLNAAQERVTSAIDRVAAALEKITGAGSGEPESK